MLAFVYGKNKLGIRLTYDTDYGSTLLQKGIRFSSSQRTSLSKVNSKLVTTMQLNINGAIHYLAQFRVYNLKYPVIICLKQIDIHLLFLRILCVDLVKIYSNGSVTYRLHETLGT